MFFEKDHFKVLRQPSDAVVRLLRLERVPPNLITLAGLALVAPMVWAFMAGRPAAGGLLFVLSAVLDALDGAAARFQQAWIDRMSDIERERVKRVNSLKHVWLRLGVSQAAPRPNRSGWFERHLNGKNLDPLVDKIRYFAFLLAAGLPVLDGRLMLAAGAFAVLLTARPLVQNLFERNGVEWDTGANLFGKVKGWAEFALGVSLAAAMMRGIQDRPDAVMALNALFAIATLLGGLSFATQALSARRAWKSRAGQK